MANSVSYPRVTRSRTNLLLVAAALAWAALFSVALQAAQTLNFVTPSSSGALSVARRQATSLRRSVAVAARGGAEEEDDDDEYEFQPPVVIEDLKPGEELEGVVTRILKFGAFVDVGADSNQDGLVPTSKLRDAYTENPEDVVQVGQTVKCWVVEVKGDKLTLSMSKNKVFQQTGPRADVSLFEPLAGKTDEWLEGRVVITKPFGAFVSIPAPNGEKGTAQGLVHITQIKNGFVQNVEDELSIGDTVKVRVLSVDTGANKIALSMKDENAAPEPAKGGKDVQAFAELSDEEWLPGKVVSIVNFGAFVEATTPSGVKTEGLVHISEIQDGFIEDPAEVLEVGMDVKIRVIEADVAKGKLAFSMKEKAAAAEATA